MGRKIKAPTVERRERDDAADAASASTDPYTCAECHAARRRAFGPCEDCEHVPAFPTLTDAGNAQRFVDRYVDRVRFCGALGGWLVFDGTRWKADEMGHVNELAKKVARAIYGEAEHAQDEDPSDITRHARLSESASRLFAMLRLASSDPRVAIAADRFDRDPMLLNTPNGTIDLATGTLRPHEASDYITKCTGAAFDDAARSPQWERFLSEALGGDDAVVGLLQRMTGYAATGHTSEERLFLIDGPGGGGKSTFIEAIKSALGSYAMTADFTTFVNARRDGPRNDIARLAGARLVTSSEVEDGSKLASALVKQLTGGDAFTARFLHKEAFTFKPQLTLVLVCNEPPEADDADTGLWRRIVRIPFVNPPPKEKRDPKLKAALFNVDVSGPAILAWIVRGCLEWQRIGLAAPVSIDEATEAYRSAQDPLAEFWDDECIFDENARTSRSELRGRYEQWAKKQGHAFLIGPRVLVEKARSRGARDHKVGGDRVWMGIGLKPRVDFGKAEDHRDGASTSQSAPMTRSAPLADPTISGVRALQGTKGTTSGVSSQDFSRVSRTYPNQCPEVTHVPHAGNGTLPLLVGVKGGRS